MATSSRRQALQLAAAGGALAFGGLLHTDTAQAQESKAVSVDFDAVDKAVKSVDLKAYAAGGKMAVTKAELADSPRNVLEKICPIYKSIKPILLALSEFPLLPKAWRDALKTFISVMDAICPA